MSQEIPDNMWILFFLTVPLFSPSSIQINVYWSCRMILLLGPERIEKKNVKIVHEKLNKWFFLEEK